MPAVSAEEHRLRLRRRPVGRRPRRQEPPPAHHRHRRRVATRSSRPTAQTIAFSAQYDGNTDVYTIPRRRRRADAADLAPRPGHRPRLHAGRQGGAVLVAPARLHRTGTASSSPCRSTGGMPTQLPIPWGFEASYSPDGEYIAYTPVRDATAAVEALPRRHPLAASGSTTSRTTTSIEIPQPKDRCNDLDPHWVGNTVYFRSDRDGEYNMFAYDAGAQGRQAGHAVHRLPGPRHRHRRRASSSSSRPATCTCSTPARREPQRLKVGVATDLAETRPRFVKGAKYVRDVGVSPSGARAVVEFRGEIVTVPAEKGDPRNLTNTHRRPRARPGLVARTARRSPTSPTRAASTSCVLAPQDGKGEAEDDQAQRHRVLLRTRSGRRDSKKIALPRQLADRSTGSTSRAARSRRSSSRSTASAAG